MVNISQAKHACSFISLLICHLYKIINGLTDFPEAPVTNRKNTYHCRSIVQAKSLCMPNFKTCSDQNSFFPATIRNWNKLPKQALDCGTLQSFKSQLYLILTFNYPNWMHYFKHFCAYIYVLLALC